MMMRATFLTAANVFLGSVGAAKMTLRQVAEKAGLSR